MTYYSVAQNIICIDTTKDQFIDDILPSYIPFKITCTPLLQNVILKLTCVSYDSFKEIELKECILKTENDLGHTTIYEIENGYCIDLNYQAGFPTHRMVCSKDFSKCKAAILLEEPFGRDVLNSFIMMAFSIRCTYFQTIMLHASSIIQGDNGFAFMGVSGTGKSTHSSLWLKYIPNTELLNDDHPAIKIMQNGEVHIFGSPWSGKTDCYKNKERKLKGLILLKQGPKNEIKKLRGIESYFVIQNNSSKLSKNRENIIQLGNNIETIINTIPVFHLENLPNKDAALLCYNTLVKSSKTAQDNK